MKTVNTLPNPPATEWAVLKKVDKALYLAGCGFKVLPVWGVDKGVCECSQIHSASANLTGKHPKESNWPDKATLEPDQIRAWFFPESPTNIGIYAEGSKIVVIDVDVKSGGLESWERFEAWCDYSIPKTVEVRTGLGNWKGVKSRGHHFYFELPDGYKFPANLKHQNLPGIDIRLAALVVAPGSTHSSGAIYEWADGGAPWETPIAKLTEEMLGYIAKVGTRRSRKEMKSTLGDSEWEEKWSKIMETSVTNTPYASAALRNACSELKKMRGRTGLGRNNTLNAICFSLGHLVGGGQLDFHSTKAELRNAMRIAYDVAWDYKEGAVDNTLRDWGGGFELGAMEPKYPVELDDAFIEWVAKHFGAQQSASVEPFLETARQGFFSGRANLRRETLATAIKELGPVVSGPGGRLWSYDGGVWTDDGKAEVTRRIAALLGEDARPSHVETTVLFMAAEKPSIDGLGPVELINTRNGMLNWQTGEFFPHHPDYFSCVQIKTEYLPGETCPTVDAFLEEMVHGDLIDLIWEIIGVCISNSIGFQRAIFLDGPGRNGKGTLLRLISNLVPDSAIAAVELQRLGVDKFASAELFGKTVNLVGDLSHSALSDAGMFKQLTGQDQISAQVKYGQPFKFTNQATLIFAANELPPIKDKSIGMRERLLVVPFDKRTLSREEIDPSLEARMARELPGVLNKAILGLRRATLAGGFTEVTRCRLAVDTWMDAPDGIQKWVVTRLEVSGEANASVAKPMLWSDYVSYCEENGQTPLGRTKFFGELEELQSEKIKFRKSDGTYIATGVKFAEGKVATETISSKDDF